MGNFCEQISRSVYWVINDMNLRQLHPETQNAYIRHAKELNDYFG